jgi:hypothetical protein
MHNLADSRLAAYIQSKRFFLYLPFQIKAAKSNNYSFVEIRLQISCQITEPAKMIFTPRWGLLIYRAVILTSAV